MRNVYLRINYGCDDRFKKVSRTIRVSAPHFKEIRVTNFGPDKNSEKFSDLIKEFTNLKVIDMGRFYHACITEDLLRHHYMDVPDGEWVAWLDSDWRFPPYFLEHMQEEIEHCEQENKTHLYSCQLGHYVIRPAHGNTYEEYTQEIIDRQVEKWEKQLGYGFPILQKVDKKNIYTSGFLGNHSYVIHIPYARMNIPKMYHLHMRDFSDHAYCSTMAHQSWWYIGHNVFKLEEQEEIYNSWEYDALENFKIANRCFTSNHFHEMKEDPSFREKLRQLWKRFENSKVFGCQQMYRMAIKYDMEFLGIDTPDIPCDGVCCNYKCGKIKDLPI